MSLSSCDVTVFDKPWQAGFQPVVKIVIFVFFYELFIFES